MSNLSISIKDIQVPKYWSSDSGKIKVKVKAKNSDGETDVLGHSATVAIHLSTDEKVDSLSDLLCFGVAPVRGRLRWPARLSSGAASVSSSTWSTSRTLRRLPERSGPLDSARLGPGRPCRASPSVVWPSALCDTPSRPPSP